MLPGQPDPEPCPTFPFERPRAPSVVVPVVIVRRIMLLSLGWCLAVNPALGGHPSDAAPDQETTGTDALRDRLYAEYRFDGNTEDSSGFKRHAKSTGRAVTFVEDRHGTPGQALQFDGHSGIDIGGPFKFSSFSVLIWLKPDVNQDTWSSIIDNNHGNGINWVSQQHGDQDNFYHFGVGRAKEAGAVVSFRLVPDRWQHLALVKTATEVLVYLDGKLVEKAPARTQVNYANPPHLRLGTFAGGGRFWKGAMDDVAIYRRPLTAEEVGELAGMRAANQPALEAPPQMAGKWLWSNGGLMDATQDGGRLSWPGEDTGFTYSTDATWNGTSFVGVTARRSKRNGCVTKLKLVLTPTSETEATVEGSALDAKCDLRPGFSESFTMRRLRPLPPTEVAPDFRGTWLLSNGSVMKVAQDGRTISWPGEDDGFTYSTELEWQGAEFSGACVRRNKRDGCTTRLKFVVMPLSENEAFVHSSAMDEHCDLRLGFQETFTWRRMTQEEMREEEAKEADRKKKREAAVARRQRELATEYKLLDGRVMTGAQIEDHNKLCLAGFHRFLLAYEGQDQFLLAQVIPVITQIGTAARAGDAARVKQLVQQALANGDAAYIERIISRTNFGDLLWVLPNGTAVRSEALWTRALADQL